MCLASLAKILAMGSRLPAGMGAACLTASRAALCEVTGLTPPPAAWQLAILVLGAGF